MRLALIFFLTTPSIAIASIQTETLCLNSFGKKPIKLEFKRIYDNESAWVGGYVKYSTSNKAISIALESSESTPTSDTSPDDTTSTWIEIKNGQITGSYAASSQGGNNYNFLYENFETKETTNFIVDPNIDYTSTSGCQWKSNE